MEIAVELKVAQGTISKVLRAHGLGGRRVLCKPDERVLLDDAVRYIMQATGRTRRQAEARLLQALKSGELTASGIPEGGEIAEEIPAEVFQAIPTEH